MSLSWSIKASFSSTATGTEVRHSWAILAGILLAFSVILAILAQASAEPELDGTAEGVEEVGMMDELWATTKTVEAKMLPRRCISESAPVLKTKKTMRMKTQEHLHGSMEGTYMPYERLFFRRMRLELHEKPVGCSAGSRIHA